MGVHLFVGPDLEFSGPAREERENGSRRERSTLSLVKARGLYRVWIAGYDAKSRIERLTRPVVPSDGTVREVCFLVLVLVPQLAARPRRRPLMAMDPKSTPPPGTHTARADVKGIRVFTYPKVIFMFPTMIVALICAIGMKAIGDKTVDPTKVVAATPDDPKVHAADAATGSPVMAKHDRFKRPENLFAVLFLGVFAFNLLIMAIDFPRFTIVAVGLLVGFLVFFILWIGAAFDVELMRAVRGVMSSIYVIANAEFYFIVSLIMAIVLAIVYATRYLDYYQILPNEILHHHGPMSDLERFPTMNLKFDKEIPDVLEFAFLGAGRLVLHVTEERKAIVLDNVLFINSVEASLKNLMSRMEVRVTTDQEVADM